MSIPTSLVAKRLVKTVCLALRLSLIHTKVNPSLIKTCMLVKSPRIHIFTAQNALPIFRSWFCRYGNSFQKVWINFLSSVHNTVVRDITPTCFRETCYSKLAIIGVSDKEIVRHFLLFLPSLTRLLHKNIALVNQYKEYVCRYLKSLFLELCNDGLFNIRT